MHEAIQTLEYKGYEIKILRDDDCENPNEWGDDVFLVGFHKQFWVAVPISKTNNKHFIAISPLRPLFAP